jgi:putative transposase
VIDAYSRRVLGWALGDHCRTDLVVDALQMALWRRQGADGCVHHSDHACAVHVVGIRPSTPSSGPLSSMGSIGDAYDNALAESFFATLQTDLLDRRSWPTREELAQAIFEYVEAFYNPIRRHSSLEMLAPNDYEHRHNAASVTAAA